jgi:hypothetical protein
MRYWTIQENAAESGRARRLEEARVLENPEVLGDGWEGHVVRRGEFPHRAVALRQALQHGAPNGVGERGEDRV